jgi:hypothetical protein
MFDELELLRESPNLLRLLDHYVEAAGEDREGWRDRKMELEGAEAPELVKLHGLLIAFDWLEQNTGNVTAASAGPVPGCYRVTPAGVRAAKLARGGVPVEADAAAREDEPEPKRRRPRAKKAVKGGAEETPKVAA